MKSIFRKQAGGLLLSLLAVLPFCAQAQNDGGITLNSTRIIYPLEARQANVSVRNTSGKSTFLIQSWVESGTGNKTKDFVVTPPLFTSGPGNENMLRLMFSGGELPRDRESLYFFNSKAIPSLDKKALEGKNSLILATVTRIKLFVRPAGLKPLPKDAPSALRFSKAGGNLKIHNPTPYYLTLTDIKIGSQKLQNIMVAPMSDDSIPLPPGSTGDIKFSTINDFGGVTKEQKGVMQ